MTWEEYGRALAVFRSMRALAQRRLYAYGDGKRMYYMGECQGR